jgi:hypothetical protein
MKLVFQTEMLQHSTVDDVELWWNFYHFFMIYLVSYFVLPEHVLFEVLETHCLAKWVFFWWLICLMVSIWFENCSSWATTIVSIGEINSDYWMENGLNVVQVSMIEVGVGYLLKIHKCVRCDFMYPDFHDDISNS